MSECKKYENEIGGAASGVSERARAHAESCGACGETMRAGESLGRILRGLERVEAPADFEFRLRARIASRKGGRGRFQLAGFGSPYGYATAAAAFCVLALAASLYFLPGQRHAPVEARNEGAAVRNETAPPQPSSLPGPAPTNTPSPLVARVTVPTLTSHQSNGGKSHVVALKRVKETAEVVERQKSLTTNSLSLSAAPVISIPLKIQVGAPAEPLRVVLRDEKGTAHVVPMRTVSFGSQELLSRDVAVTRSGAKNEEGVW
ncbi:MAG TPA: hypothetical protein VFA21_10660 [Pyrinomonadaceae bacterium]|nr:hypothetical protein [Pyrinomonadaceae bacterium]